MKAIIIGASGGIGAALADRLEQADGFDEILRLSRSGPGAAIDLTDEASVAAAAEAAGPADLVIVATGLLSDGDRLQPEKSFKHQSMAAFEDVFRINTFGPALAAKHFIPNLPRKGRGVFAALSARVGSISDNRIGGWHAYRASKAALNMLIRNYAIEQARRNPDFIAVGLHPGTVDTALSEPFQSSVPDKQIFTPAESAAHLLEVVDGLAPADSGKVFDWAGEEVPA